MGAVNRSRPASRLGSFRLWIHWRWRFGSTSWPPTSWSVSLSLSWPASPHTSGTTRIRATATATWSRISSPSPTVSGSLPELFSVKDRDSIQRSLQTTPEIHILTAWTQILPPVHPPQALTNPQKPLRSHVRAYYTIHANAHKKRKSNLCHCFYANPDKNYGTFQKLPPRFFFRYTAGVLVTFRLRARQFSHNYDRNSRVTYRMIR